MGKRRPINRRPWKRPPWKGHKRPLRWNGSTSAIDTETSNILIPLPVLPPGAEGTTGPLQIIIDGQVDVEPWCDDQTALLDRLVGDFTVYGRAAIDTAGSNLLNVGLPMIRAGLVVLQELEEEPLTDYPNIAMFNDEEIEDREWMWLRSWMPENTWFNAQPLAATDQTNGVQCFADTIHLDLSVRRKIGPKDALAMYLTWAPPHEGFSISVNYHSMFRAVLLGR